MQFQLGPTFDRLDNDGLLCVRLAGDDGRVVGYEEVDVVGQPAEGKQEHDRRKHLHNLQVHVQ